MRHGTLTGYTTDKCRCAACRGANAEYSREWKKRNRSAEAKYSKRYHDKIAASRDENGLAALVKTHGSSVSYGHGCRCEDCTRANRDKQRAYYKTPSGRRAFAKTGKNTVAKRRKWLREQKASWCLDCGFIGPSEAMDFDHRPGVVKLFGLGTAIGAYQSKPAMAREILKCDLVCANCHRIRTATRSRERAQEMEAAA